MAAVVRGGQDDGQVTATGRELEARGSASSLCQHLARWAQGLREPSVPKGTELLSPAALVCLANFLYGQKEAGEEDVLQLPRVPFGDCADAPRCEPT